MKKLVDGELIDLSPAEEGQRQAEEAQAAIDMIAEENRQNGIRQSLADLKSRSPIATLQELDDKVNKILDVLNI